MIDRKDWALQELVEFNDVDLDLVNLIGLKSPTNALGADFNAELRFSNCRIKGFAADTVLIGQKVVFRNCRIDYLSCYATYFFGGFEMYDTVVTGQTSFSCGVHNIAPNAFVIEQSRFHGYVDFWDVWFGGPVRIESNLFEAATNLNVYLNERLGIDPGVACTIANNQGQLDKCTEDDPFVPHPPIA